MTTLVDDSRGGGKYPRREKPLAGGLWRDNPATPEGKYLVMRRDGTIPDWPHFVISANDPCAAYAISAYAWKAELLGLDPAYIEAVRNLAYEWMQRPTSGDPDRGRHREDLPAVIAMMRLGRGM